MITTQRLYDLLWYIEEEVHTKDVKDDIISVIKSRIKIQMEYERRYEDFINKFPNEEFSTVAFGKWISERK